jgi:transcriptional regulator with XRE-family HTH domain
LADQEHPRIPAERISDSEVNEHLNDAEEQAKIATRLREAREYVGLLQEEVASALGIPRASVSAMEAGKRRVTGLELRRLARIYRKPVGWLLGEESIELGDAEPLYRAAESLSPGDRDQVLRFAEFLAAAGKPAGSRTPAARARMPKTDHRKGDGGQ